MARAYIQDLALEITQTIVLHVSDTHLFSKPLRFEHQPRQAKNGMVSRPKKTLAN